LAEAAPEILLIRGLVPMGDKWRSGNVPRSKTSESRLEDKAPETDSLNYTITFIAINFL